MLINLVLSVDEETSFQASYTMGSMTIKGHFSNKTDNEQLELQELKIQS